MAALRSNRFFFDRSERDELYSNPKSFSYDYVKSNSCTESDIIKHFGEGAIRRSTVNEAVNRLESKGDIFVFMFKKSDGTLLPEGRGDLNPAQVSKLISIPVDRENYIGNDLIDKIGGQIVAPSNVLRHFRVSQNFDKSKSNNNLNIHFVQGCNTYSISMGKSIWDELGGRPLVLFFTNNFKGSSPDGKESILNIDVGTLDFFDIGLVVLKLPLNGVKPPIKNFKSKLQKNATHPLLGSLALTFYPNNKNIVASLFAPDSFSVCEVESVADMMDIEKWVLSGVTWPEYLPPEDCGFQVPYPASLRKSSKKENPQVRDFFKSKSSPSYLDCLKWLDFHIKTNSNLKENETQGPRCEKDDNFCDQIIHNSWVLPNQILVSLQNSHFIVST